MDTDYTFAQMLDDLASSYTAQPNESKLQRNARHIAELQQIVHRMLERLQAVEAAYLGGWQEGFVAGTHAARRAHRPGSHDH